MSTVPAILALDLGTSSLKALLVDQTGRLLAAARHAYPTAHPQPGFAEQDPDDWWRAAVDAVGEVRSAAEIVAISLTGQMHGTVVLDAAHAPLAPAIIWADGRSAREADELTERIGAVRINELAGSPIAAGFQAATLTWLRAHRPELWRQIGTVMLPKDWLAFRLTGTRATEPSDAAGTLLFDSEHCDWSEPILGALALDSRTLPTIVPSGTAIGGLTASAADALGLRSALSVILAGGDAPCGAVAGGGATADSALVLLSTGAQVMQTASTYAPDPHGRLHVWPAALPGPSHWNRMGATLNAGLAIEWLCAIVGADSPAVLLDQAAGVPAGACGLLFLPYLIGERTPLMNSAARGCFLGLHESHGQAELARAVVEGIAVAVHSAMEAVVEGSGQPAEVLLGGGGARHPLWARVLADVLGLPVRSLAVTDLSAFGAAMLAAHHLSWLHLPDDADRWRQAGEPIAPDPARHALYRELAEVAGETYRSTRPLAERLSNLRQESAERR